MHAVTTKHELSLLLSHFPALKDLLCINMPRINFIYLFIYTIKKTEGEKWRIVGMRDGGMKQADIARVLNVSQSVLSRLLKKL